MLRPGFDVSGSGVPVSDLLQDQAGAHGDEHGQGHDAAVDGVEKALLHAAGGNLYTSGRAAYCRV